MIGRSIRIGRRLHVNQPLRLIHMCPSGASEPTVVYEEPLALVFLMNVFIREVPMEKNVASECIRTVAATYGCKIFITMRIRCERVRIRCEMQMTPQAYQFMLHKGRLITGMRMHSLNSKCFEI